MANAAATPHRQYIVTLNTFEYQLLHQALIDGFLLSWLGDSNARIIAQRNYVNHGPFQVRPTIKFVGRGGRTISTFRENHLQEALEVLPRSPLQRIAILVLGSNDIDVASWPADVPKNMPANHLLSLRDELLNSYDHVFVVGFPERDTCRGRNPELVHQLSLKCNQRLNNVLRGFYIKLPNQCFNYLDDRRFTVDGVHFTTGMYDFILRFIQFKLRAIMSGDPEFVKIVNV